MEIKCECLYCGHVFLKHVYYMVEDLSSLNIMCERDRERNKGGCGSRNIKFWRVKTRDVFGYSYVSPEKKRGKPDLY